MKSSRMAVTLSAALLVSAMMCSSPIMAQSRGYAKTTSSRGPRNIRLAKVRTRAEIETELETVIELETAHSSSTCTSCSKASSSFARSHGGYSNYNHRCGRCCLLDWNLIPRIANGIEDAIDSLLPCCKCNSGCNSECRRSLLGGWTLRPINLCLPVPTFFRCNDCCDETFASDPGLIIEEEDVPMTLPSEGEEIAPPAPPKPPKNARTNSTLHEVRRSASNARSTQSRVKTSSQKSKTQKARRKTPRIAYQLDNLNRVQRRLSENSSSTIKSTATYRSLSRNKQSLSKQMIAAPVSSSKAKQRSLSATMFPSPKTAPVQSIAPAVLIEREASTFKTPVFIRLTSGESDVDETAKNSLRR